MASDDNRSAALRARIVSESFARRHHLDRTVSIAAQAMTTDTPGTFAAHDMNMDWSPRPGWGAEQGIPGNPIHHALLGWLGAGIVENLDLENLAATARRLKRYEFMLTFAPIPVEGGSGSPVNPIAIF